jgi:DNA-binding winged helix-turn-helix (wHTH) protein
MSPVAPDIIYEAGSYSIDSARRLVTRCGERIHVQHRGFDLLLVLISSRDRIVERNELLDMVWGADQHVIPANVDQQVYLLRQALGDSSKAPRYIATFGRCGYRFIHAVVERLHPIRHGDVAGTVLAQQSGVPIARYHAGNPTASVARGADGTVLMVFRDEIVVRPNSDLGRLVLTAASLPAPLQKAAVDLVAKLRAD